MAQRPTVAAPMPSLGGAWRYTNGQFASRKAVERAGMAWKRAPLARRDDLGGKADGLYEPMPDEAYDVGPHWWGHALCGGVAPAMAEILGGSQQGDTEVVKQMRKARDEHKLSRDNK